jgi:hypothetical protein
MIAALQQLNPAGHFRIVDCRSRLNAFANVAKGGGTENESNYTKCQMDFVGIDNIHVMRESLHRLSQRGSPLFACSWLEHLEAIILSAADLSRILDEAGESVLVHCSDGWDRTPQLCSLAQILLDPFFRTMHGFQILIEKEWVRRYCPAGLPLDLTEAAAPFWTQICGQMWPWCGRLLEVC